MGGSGARFGLRWTDPNGAEVERDLPDGSLSIGRASTNDLVLRQDRVSRLHAQIDVDGQRATIRDLGSRNGTFLGGDLVTVSDLAPGEDIGIGPFSLHFVALGQPEIAPTLVDVEGVPGPQSADPMNIVAAPKATPDDPMHTVAPAAATPSPPPAVESPVPQDPMHTVPPPVAALSPAPAPTVEPRAPQDPMHTVPPPAAAPSPTPARPAAMGQLPTELLGSPVVSEKALAAAGLEVKAADYVALGGGMGSFVFVDLLRNAGVQTTQIAIIGNEEQPYGRYERLTRHSQIPKHERIRSNSESCPDNIWGFPGYAVREAWTAFSQGHVGEAVGPIWAILGEPVIATTYTPKLGYVFQTMDREARRIGWTQMHQRGRIRAIRKTDEGRLVAIISTSDEHGHKHIAVAGRFLHLAVGYPAIELLPDLTEYREKYEKPVTIGRNDQMPRVIAAYESHDHVYAYLREHGGTVLLRGRGIVASRVIQRLVEERQINKDIIIVHLHRSRITKGHKFGLSRRAVDHQFEFQPFNWPKACWGGEYRDLLERSSDDERKRLLDAWGGTTTASRPDWRRMVRQGTEEGWYRAEFGVVREVKPTTDGRVSTIVDSRLAGGGSLDLTADFVIDCTGLEASPERAPFIADLYKTYGLAHNPRNRLAVTNEFEIAELRHGDSKGYAAGALTLGGPHAGVDTFLALQYCAVTSVRAMRTQKAPGLRSLAGLYSFGQWLKWAKGQAP